MVVGIDIYHDPTRKLSTEYAVELSCWVMVDVDANDHHLLDWDVAAPELSADLAVHLQHNLLDHAVHLLLIGYGSGTDHLAGNGIICVTQLLHRRVSVFSLERNHDDDHLQTAGYFLLQVLHICLRSIIGEKRDSRRFDRDSHLRSNCLDKLDEPLHYGLVLVAADHMPIIQCHWNKTSVVGDISTPVGLEVHCELDSFTNYKLFGVQCASLQSDRVLVQFKAPVSQQLHRVRVVVYII